jgi:methyl-accepting chemotaxis protein
MDKLVFQTEISGTFGEYLVLSSVAMVAVALIVGLAYVISRRSLVFRIFSLVVPSMGIIAVMGGVIGLNHLSIGPYVMAVTGAVAAGVTALSLVSKSVIRTVNEQVAGMASSVAQLSATAKQSASTAQEQSSTVSQVTSTIEEINQMGKVTSEGAEEVMNMTYSAVEKSREGLDKVKSAVLIMETIAQVGDIVEAVNDLAEQSNLLAVNASIEAAKAGDAGRGFSVVATEVRNLAEQSKQATAQIRNAIGRNEEGRRAILDVEQVILSLSSVLEESQEKSRQISGAVVQQSAGIRQISEAMQNVAEGGQNTAVGASQVEGAVDNLQSIASNLNEFVTGERK